MIVGHHDARRRLLEIPPGAPVLLTGPSGIGKHAVALATAHHFASPVDVVAYRPVRMDDVRELTTWLRTGSVSGPGKAAALDLDGSRPEVAQALLKLLEEPPASTWLVLSASGAVPRTVASRVTTLTLHPLTEVETQTVLAGLGIMDADAWRLTNLAGGRPGYALAFRDALGGRSRALTLIHAVSRKDWGLIAKVLAGQWDSAGVGALQLWLADVLNGTTRAYAPGEKMGLETLVPRANLVDAERALALPVPPALAIGLATRKILG